MTVYEKIQFFLRSQWESGATQLELSRKFGLSPQYICKILNPKKGLDAISHMELSTLEKFFPDFDIVFSRENTTIHQTGNGSAAVINGGVAIASGESVLNEANISDKIIESDMCDACKIKALKIVRGK